MGSLNQAPSNRKNNNPLNQLPLLRDKTPRKNLFLRVNMGHSASDNGSEAALLDLAVSF